ncbi:MAG: tRNA (N(6)-L-threonylcarbamoyladenosine(37)-C(2))-methylthiotransferase MtaB [Clostridia bacterium]|nr:tRNA (N(6)-L-threonylcarbamoyladenosine(37)-C(2))-methylthiotransferase MtaB [Clostridia bacterium]
MNRKVAFYTLGCKVNQYETDVMTSIFEKDGYEVVEYEEYADVYIVNTCTVTNMSDRKSRQILRRAKEINPDAVLCAVGCYAQVAQNVLEDLKEIDIILGTNDKREILSAVNKFIEDKERYSKVTDILSERKYVEWNAMPHSLKARAEIKIQDGCDRYCTYCLIPYARGPVRSRDMDNIYNEIKEISKTEIKEIVITGIHISSYGKDLADKPKLIDLLEKISDIEGIERIRLGSLEPLIIDEEFVTRLKALPKVCNHFHLSLQSGCDETLKRMNRRYTTAEFKDRVELLRKHLPEVALTTDIIVGFPGETDEEFECTYEFLKDIKFSKMHVFKYSPRIGTKAAEFPNQIDGTKKDSRSEKLIELSENNEKEFASKYIGNEIEVLFENGHDGHTTNYIEVYSENEQELNKIIKVIPTKFENGKLLV